MMKYCSKCWADCEDDSKFCASCGAALKEADTAERTKSEDAVIEELKPEKVPPPEPETIIFAGNRTRTGQAINQKIESHLVKAIISTICCCMPFGIAAIIFAAQVDSKLRTNDYEGALESSKKANLWGNMAIAIGILIQLFWVFFYWTYFVNMLNR
jgi:uncharacterized membrane protein YvbJ